MTEKIFKVNLAATLQDISDLRFPVLGSPKIDGIRCYIKDNIPYSRTNKKIPNKAFCDFVLSAGDLLNDIDSEIVVGHPTDNDVYTNTTSGIMSHDKIPDFHIYAFDIINDAEYSTRLMLLHSRFSLSSNMLPNIKIVENRLLNNPDELYEYEKECLALGYEGIIVRNPNAKYKNGRSTIKGDQGVVKIKRFTDAEALIIGFEEQTTNNNDKQINELGRSFRSSSKENLIPADTLGALVCVTPDGIEFNIGTGFDHKTRKEIWDNRGGYLNKYVKYKFFDIGIKDAPRHPVFLGIRDEIDL